jgi:chorismate-pyruvate lyase
MWHIITEQHADNPPAGVLPTHWRWVVFRDSYTKEFARRFGQAMRFVVLRESVDHESKHWLRESEWRLGQEVCLAAVTSIPMNMPDALWFNLKERPIGEILFNPDHPANKGLVQRVQMEYSLDRALLEKQTGGSAEQPLYLRRSVFSLGDYFITIQEVFYPALFRALEGYEHEHEHD